MLVLNIYLSLPTSGSVQSAPLTELEQDLVCVLASLEISPAHTARRRVNCLADGDVNSVILVSQCTLEIIQL